MENERKIETKHRKLQKAEKGEEVKGSTNKESEKGQMGNEEVNNTEMKKVRE